jgi:hypothetical protein
LRLLKNSGLFTSIELKKLVDEEVVSFIKIKAEVHDGSILYINEMHTETYQKYSYHWQKSDGELIVRWDNKQHFRELKTYPHHKHVGTKVLACHRVALEEVLQEIKDSKKKKQKSQKII